MTPLQGSWIAIPLLFIFGTRWTLIVSFPLPPLYPLMLRKTWGFHGSDYEECPLIGYKNPARTSQETHYFSARVPSRLMLCKIWGILGGNYEECRHLGYKNPVRTSQETHYFSATVPSRLMLCKIWGIHGGDYEECRLLRSDIVWLL
jgi:hypothetical protein